MSDSGKKKVDEDWKRQAEEEKAKIDSALPRSVAGAEEAPPAATPSDAAAGPEGAAEKDAAPEPARRPTSRVSFISLLEQLAAQAMAGLGQMPDPRTGRPMVDLELARDAIDMLALLEEKTRGNLEPDEKMMIEEALHSLQQAFLAIQQAYERSQPAGGPPPETPPSS